jgi:hypothetical protein
VLGVRLDDRLMEGNPGFPRPLSGLGRIRHEPHPGVEILPLHAPYAAVQVTPLVVVNEPFIERALPEFRGEAGRDRGPYAMGEAVQQVLRLDGTAGLVRC